jgi:hypothetical protein
MNSLKAASVAVTAVQNLESTQNEGSIRSRPKGLNQVLVTIQNLQRPTARALLPFNHVK